ncbi:MAG: NAD(P)/FAD-dependent oxidoreductase [Candidatus Dormibacteria bacterium]
MTTTSDASEVWTGAPPTGNHVAIIGAGPAGLTAAYQLRKRGVPLTVFEADSVVGGISRTAEAEGWRFDIGGHRFFTKVGPVERLWYEILGEENFLLRPRMSRIFYRGTMYDYPLKAFNALKGLGLLETLRCFLSYGWVRIRPPKDQTKLEGWVAARFGWRLYRTFFQTYNEKVWGIPANQIEADWAAQRIKNLSLLKAVTNALLPSRGGGNVTSLIEEFRYPKYGPGMMWEFARDKVEALGGTVRMNSPVTALHHAQGRVEAVTTGQGGAQERIAASDVISSMPLSQLVLAMDPPAPDEVRRAARGLRYRDFLTVAVVVPMDCSFPDNWIYIHDPEVKVGRIQNFGVWSPYMVKDGKTCLGLEYFVNEGDEVWEQDDDSLVRLAKRELDRLGLARIDRIESGYVVRMPKAYPVYDSTYRANVDVLRSWLETNAANVHPVGRNGQHRYNNQDHSMYTAMLAVENVLGADHDIWSVNVEDDYHEEGELSAAASRSMPRSTGLEERAPLVGGPVSTARP